MDSRSYPYHGQCLYGAIHFEVADFQTRMAHCHCSMCRKFHGAAFATYGEVLLDGFRWQQGEETLCAYRAENGTTRKFCKHCGSSLVFESSDADESAIEIALGTLDTPIPGQADAHIFVTNGANWHTLSNGLPQYSAGRKYKPSK